MISWGHKGVGVHIHYQARDDKKKNPPESQQRLCYENTDCHTIICLPCCIVYRFTGEIIQQENQLWCLFWIVKLFTRGVPLISEAFDISPSLRLFL